MFSTSGIGFTQSIFTVVMAGLVPAIHGFDAASQAQSLFTPSFRTRREAA
jgi:hypothetical protein